MRSGSEAGSYLRLIDSCITQLKAQGPSRTCNESKEEKRNLEAIDAAEVDSSLTISEIRKGLRQSRAVDPVLLVVDVTVKSLQSSYTGLYPQINTVRILPSKHHQW